MAARDVLTAVRIGASEWQYATPTVIQPCSPLTARFQDGDVHMHGIIFTALKEFVIDTYDKATWDRICDEAGVSGKQYLPLSAYPDEELVALVDAAVPISELEQPALLQAFGRSIVPQLVDMYGIYIDDSWTGLELIENVEGTIHEALRSGNSLEYEPPAISATRVDDDVVVVRYGSSRGLCDVAKGLIEGIGDYYSESYDIYERQCLHDGAAACELVAVSDGTSRQRANSLIDGARE